MTSAPTPLPDPCDVLIVGAGSAGYSTALRAAELGLSVILIEKDKVGGTCLHRGCIPAKALVHSAQVADQVRTAARFGVEATLTSIDLGQLQDHSNEVVGRLHTGLTGLIEQRGISVVHGEATSISVSPVPSVQVGGQVLRGRRLVLAQGSIPRTGPFPIDGERIITSDHVWSMPSLPHSAIVLGAGAIGVEIASAWQSLGVDVTLLEGVDRILPGEEDSISTTVARAMKRAGVGVRTGISVQQIDRSEDGARVRLESGEELTADVVLIAIGRAPAVPHRDWETWSISHDRGWARVNDHLMTNIPGVFAVGDLVAGPQLAHRGFTHGIHVAEWIAHLEGKVASPPPLPKEHLYPRVTYSSPPVVSVGLTRAQARERGLDVRTSSYSLSGNGKARIQDTNGDVLVIAERNGPVVGIHMVGSGVTEMVGEAQVITEWGALPEEVAQLIHAHPTLSEALGEAMMSIVGAPLHSHR